MLDKPTGSRGSFSFLGSVLAIAFLCAIVLPSRSVRAQVGGAGPDLIPCFTQNLGGGSSPTALPAPIPGNVIPFSPTGTLITFDPSCSYLPVSPDPNQTYLYYVSWDFGDPTPDLFTPTAVPLPATPANLAILLQPVSHTYTNEGIYSQANAGTPAGTSNRNMLGPRLTIQIFVQTSIVLNATATQNSALLTGIVSTTGVAAGATVSGVGVPANTTVISFTPTTVTLSNPVTVASTGPFTLTVLTPASSNFTTGAVQIVNANLPPIAALQNIGSAPTANGAPLTVTASTSYDPDGYILWAAIDWGDGISELVKQPTATFGANLQPPAFLSLLPNPLTPNTNGFDLPGIPIQHLYSSPGTYKVTLSIIDNGRLITNPNTSPVPNPNPPPATLPPAVPFPLPLVPAPNDPLAALASIEAFYVKATGYGAEPDPNHRFDPRLAQDFLFVQVPGSLNAAAGQFTVDFAKANSDKLSVLLQLTSDTAVDTFNSVPVSISIGTKTGTSVPLPTFTTDAKGSFRSSKINFSFNPKKRIIKLSLLNSSLQTALGLKNQTVANGSVDAKLTITVGANLPIVTFVRFQYKAQSGTKGVGRNGHAIPGGSAN
jgi:hypothetical protein